MVGEDSPTAAGRPPAPPTSDHVRGVYGISVAAELVGIDPQSLRLYERRGLLEPARTDGGTRRYSNEDIDRLRRIADLLADGLNLAGIALVLHLQDDNARLRKTIEQSAPAARRRLTAAASAAVPR